MRRTESHVRFRFITNLSRRKRLSAAKGGRQGLSEAGQGRSDRDCIQFTRGGRFSHGRSALKGRDTWDQRWRANRGCSAAWKGQKGSPQGAAPVLICFAPVAKSALPDSSIDNRSPCDHGATIHRVHLSSAIRASMSFGVPSCAPLKCLAATGQIPEVIILPSFTTPDPL